MWNLELKTEYILCFWCVHPHHLGCLGPVSPNCPYSPNTLPLIYLALRWSLSLNESLLDIKYVVKGSKKLYVCPCQWFRAFLPISPNCPNALNTLRQKQVNLLIYGPAQPYFKQNEKIILKNFGQLEFF